MKNSDEIGSLNTLYKEYHQRFIRFARTYVSSLEIAEDIVMESFMYYWENRTSLSPNSNIPAYLLTIIKHKCLNHLRHLKTREEAESYLANMENWELNIRIATLEACDPESLFSEEIRRIIRKTLLSLPGQTRLIFIASRYHGRNHKEIAEKIGLSTKSVEYHITKALKVLRESLKDYLPILAIARYFLP